MTQTKKNLIFILILFAVVTIFAFARGGGEDEGLNITAESFSARGPEDFFFLVPYDEVACVGLLRDFSPGECLTGGSEKGILYGTWKNETLGLFQLYAVEDLDVCMVIGDQNGWIYAVSAENEETTQELYNAFVRHMRELGRYFREELPAPMEGP